MKKKAKTFGKKAGKMTKSPEKVGFLIEK